ncbi:valyl-tRNA synthetase [Synechococcus sp. CC9311]|nr:valyl-tRNA synthetase [Synechococcus sp. CC9311]
MLPIEGLVDLEALQARLEKNIAKPKKEIKGFPGLWANPNLAEEQARAELATKRLCDLN